MKIISLDSETLRKLDCIVNAPFVDSTLLEEIDFTVDQAVRFVRDTGEVPSVEVVDALIRASGGSSPAGLVELRKLAEAGATDITAVESGAGGFAIKAAVVVAAAITGAVMLRTLAQRVINAGKTPGPG